MSVLDIESLTEGKDFEAKLAAGKDGKGELPRAFFETYSAFANTDGGVVLLGVQENTDGGFMVTGIANTAKVQKALWDNLNNAKVVSRNLLTSGHVEVLNIESKSVLRITVPRATRQQQPVYVGENPLTGTYRRGHEGDYKATDEVVRRMLAEQVEDVRDMRILPGPLGLGDIEVGTLDRYRQVYRVIQPTHPWNQLNDLEFLRQIGAYRKDREAGIEGLTAAGLLMFGKLIEIKDAFPNYMLDYQEQPVPSGPVRWTDRVTTDGTWPGNLYEFYHLVIRRLSRDLKVPFRLDAGTRRDDTPVHEALREALVNTLIHADYTGRVSVLIVKRADLFGFRNPGAMRMPIETAIEGGFSDCRNRRLQDMFRYVGLGEQAGSGIAKIRSAWREQHWRAPALVDDVDPYEQTTFTLRMASLLPPDAVRELEERLGEGFRGASELQKLALVTAQVEGEVTHARLRTMSDAHSRDLTVALSSLVQRRMLESRREEPSGGRKGTYYVLPGAVAPMAGRSSVPFDAQGLGSSVPLGPSSVPSDAQGSGSSVPLQGSSVPLQERSVPLAPPSLPAEGAHDPRTASLPLRPRPTEIDDATWDRLADMADSVRGSAKAARDEVRTLLLRLTDGHYLSLPELSWLTGRTAETLRIKYVADLISEGKLAPRYPDQPTHPGQSYTKAPDPKAP